MFIVPQYNDAVRVYQEKEPWQLHHCWEILKHENKWNEKVLEISKATKGGKDCGPHTAETETESVEGDTAMPTRPLGRDSAKKKRAKTTMDASQSSAAVDYLHKMHEDSKEQSEQESKQKETIITLEKQKIELQKQHQDEKRAIMKEKNLIKREEIETHLMFTNLDNFVPSMRDW